MADTETRVVPLSRARRWTWVLVAVAVGFAAWDVYGIFVAPERPFFWIGVALDVFVGVFAWFLGRAWPPEARFGPDAVTFEQTHVPYAEITGVRRGAVSAKPFWLAFLLPTSLVLGLIAALRPAGDFDREVVELQTPDGRVRTRWRHYRTADDFLAALKEKRPDLDVRHGLDATAFAHDYTPRLGAGGGFLAFGLGVWLFFGTWFGLQLTDQSLENGPFPLEATSATLRGLTGDLTGFAPLPGVAPQFTEWDCDRDNDLILGPDPGYTDLHLQLIRKDLPEAGAVEARLRQAAGMDADTYITRIGPEDGGVDVDIPEDRGLYVEISTGCVDRDGLPRLRDDLTKLAKAMGAG
ncbi:hypothetical protein VA596_50420 [Amycolatopsis sp., V23-08]|uniref:Uncharacterized protein n=1 Tax=Amycolatopsis heterodermiae TaxID=3110235 RepID=A0ABU5RPF7_9PSEU|nr:hypothetical protein [Amycolatopsis sp., V23-08]MEA5367829.1 hypothetical protein [Amycolatopsis sp., V23-08]